MVLVTEDTPDGPREYRGLFREYSNLFLAVVDVDFAEDGATRHADLILPRARAAVRHRAEGE